jgi:iron uptake system component EfeO
VRTFTLLVAALAAVSLAACGNDDEDKGGRKVTVELTDAGCSPLKLRIPAGPTTFEATNGGTDKATEFEVLQGDRVLGEKENITEGLSGSFSLDLDPGRYQIWCGQGTPKGVLDVTGQASSDVGQAKRLYGPARISYERIEPVAESFGSLDPAIDARANDVPPGQRWTGFHRIEQAVWARGTTRGMARYADQLDEDIRALEQKVDAASYQPAQLANGAVELLNEVSKSKITGEEERYSHTDLVDFQANVDGARQAFVLLRPVLDERDPALARTVSARFGGVTTALQPYRRGDGFVDYSTVDAAQRRRLSQAVDALGEPLSRVGGTIVQR